MVRVAPLWLLRLHNLGTRQGRYGGHIDADYEVVGDSKYKSARNDRNQTPSPNLAATSRLRLKAWLRTGLQVSAQLCALRRGEVMTILGVWIYAAACWHSSRVHNHHCWAALLAAILVSVFVK